MMTRSYKHKVMTVMTRSYKLLVSIVDSHEQALIRGIGIEINTEWQETAGHKEC